MRLFVHRGADNGCTYYRQTLPLRHLEPQLHERGIEVTYSEVLDESREHDAYLFARWIEPAYLPVVCDLKRRGKRILWDLDDDLLDLNRWPAERQPVAALKIRALLLCLDLADAISVSTPALAKVVRQWHPDKVHVAPNLIDLADNPTEYRREGRQAILFTGSPSHLEDLELVREVYERTKRRHPWYFHGVRPAWLDEEYGCYIPWGSVRDYPRVCRLVRPAYAVAPLQPCRFNESKSAIKLWETATLAANVLASKVGPYLDHPAALVQPGEPFTADHFVQAIDNWQRCQEIAVRNSWQCSPDGDDQWLAFFDTLL